MKEFNMIPFIDTESNAQEIDRSRISWNNLIEIVQKQSPDPAAAIPEKMIAVQQMGRLYGQQAIEPLISALSDPLNATGIDFTNPTQSPCVASEIIHTLSELGAREAVPVLLRLVRNEFGYENEVIRVEAAHALGRMKIKEAVVTLIRRLRDNDETEAVRLASIWALGEIRDRTTISVIRDFHGYPDRLQSAIYSTLIKLNSN